jgi:hypothetical protein
MSNNDKNIKKFMTLLGIVALLFVSLYANAQSALYVEMKDFLIKHHGYAVSTEYWFDLKEGESAGRNHLFSEGYRYIILVASDDKNVANMDVSLNYDIGGNYCRDTTFATFATIQFVFLVTKEMRVVIKNASSLSHSTPSRCRFVIVRKRDF